MKQRSRGQPFAFINFTQGSGEVISGETPGNRSKRIHYQMDDPSSIKTIRQLSDNPRVASLICPTLSRFRRVN